MDSNYIEIAGTLRETIQNGSLLDEEGFNALALRLYGFQRENNPFYDAWCSAARGEEPTCWSEIPAIPTSAFKRAAIRSYAPHTAEHYFRTSGTTEGECGLHYFSSLELYETALVPPFARYVMNGVSHMRMLALTTAPDEAPHSSLVHMMKTVMERFGASGSGFFVRDDNIRMESLADALSTDVPVALLGTAFALASVLEQLAASRKSFELPPGSRIMETGGFKGRATAISRTDFYRGLSSAFGIPLHMIVNEYGMTELSSQFYDQSIVTGTSTDLKTGPRWTRVLAVEPFSGKPVPHGERGLLRIFDLANLGSVIALQTEDVGITREDGTFEVLGRVAAAQPRGCSLAAEHLLGRAQG